MTDNNLIKFVSTLLNIVVIVNNILTIYFFYDECFYKWPKAIDQILGDTYFDNYIGTGLILIEIVTILRLILFLINLLTPVP